MNTNAYPEPALWRKSPLPHHATWWSSVRADAALEFGSFRVLLRCRQLLADRIPVELGTRAFDLLLVLLEANGALVTKEELLKPFEEMTNVQKPIGNNREIGKARCMAPHYCGIRGS